MIYDICNTRQCYAHSSNYYLKQLYIWDIKSFPNGKAFYIL